MAPKREHREDGHRRKREPFDPGRQVGTCNAGEADEDRGHTEEYEVELRINRQQLGAEQHRTEDHPRPPSHLYSPPARAKGAEIICCRSNEVTRRPCVRGIYAHPVLIAVIALVYTLSSVSRRSALAHDNATSAALAIATPMRFCTVHASTSAGLAFCTPSGLNSGDQRLGTLPNPVRKPLAASTTPATSAAVISLRKSAPSPAASTR